MYVYTLILNDMYWFYEFIKLTPMRPCRDAETFVGFIVLIFHRMSEIFPFLLISSPEINVAFR